MIGPNLFNSSSVIFSTTQSIGVSLMMWVYGALMMLSGLVLYIEFGLTVPRYRLQNGIKMSIPRSGGEFVYVSFSSNSKGEQADDVCTLCS